MTKLQKHFETLGACAEGRAWVGDRSAHACWAEIEEPCWLMWWAGRTPANSRADFVRAACDCARLVLHLVPAGDPRPRLAIEAAEAWADEPSPAKAFLASSAAVSIFEADAAAATCAAKATGFSAFTAHRAESDDYAALFASYAVGYAVEVEVGTKSECCAAIRARLKQPWSEEVSA